jgi:hypothetical protein
LPSEITDPERFAEISGNAQYCAVKRLQGVVKLKLRTPKKTAIRKRIAEFAGEYSASHTVDELLDKASTVLDQKQRAAMYGEVSRILAQDLPGMWFTFYKAPFAYKDRFVGLPTPAYGTSGSYDEIWSKTGK